MAKERRENLFSLKDLMGFKGDRKEENCSLVISYNQKPIEMEVVTEGKKRS